MLIHVLKFIHLLATLGLLGLAIACLSLVSSKKFDLITRLNKIMLALVLFAMLTGTFLVIPKHFTFHTPWIQAAYFFCVIFFLGVLILILTQKHCKQRWAWYLSYLLLIGILIGIVHDAVTKSTFLISIHKGL
ncbi:MAG: hypothetical protein ACYCQI_05205 [Gammaproteobacteria bacterium]